MESQTQQPTEKIDLYANSNVKLDEVFKDMATERQNFTQAPPPQTEEQKLKDFQINDDGSPKQTTETPTPEQPQDHAKIAKSYFTLINTPLTGGAAFIAGEENSTLKLSTDDKAELIEALADIVEANSWSKPPAWLIILIVIAFSYFTIYKKAFDIRKYKKQNDALKEQNSQMQTIIQNQETQLTETETGKELQRNCPKCNTTIQYKEKQYKEAAEKLNTACKTCASKK